MGAGFSKDEAGNARPAPLTRMAHAKVLIEYMGGCLSYDFLLLISKSKARNLRVHGFLGDILFLSTP